MNVPIAIVALTMALVAVMVMVAVMVAVVATVEARGEMMAVMNGGVTAVVMDTELATVAVTEVGIGELCEL